MLFHTSSKILRADEQLDRTIEPCLLARRLGHWEQKMRDAVREDDAWAVLVTRFDGDVQIFDVENLQAAANYGSEAQLIHPQPGWDSPAPMPS